MEIVAVVDEGLGNSSYVVGLGDGGAMVVDPFRDPSPYLRIAEERGWRIRFAAETHLHADFVSGSGELAAGGAVVLASGGAPVDFDARLLDDGDEVDVGGLTLRALATPGHTPEHLAYLIEEDGRSLAVFTGGTLIVGGVARPDLLGAAHTDRLARAAYRSVRDRLLSLPDALTVYPTHGAGSFCSTGAGDDRVTTIGAERAANPLLQAADEDDFVARLLGGLGSYPPYFLELRNVNRAGPRLYGPKPPALEPRSVEDLDRLVGAGAEVVDVRGVAAFAAGHIPGSLSIPLRPQFAPWLGWLVDRGRPLVFVADADTDRRQLVRAALSIGFERLAGELAGGVDAWAAAGRNLARIPLVDAAHAEQHRRVVDVRQHGEWAAGHLPGARHVELGALTAAGDDLGGGPLLTHCAHGERAMTAASLLARAGHRDVAALAGGPEELAAARGTQLRTAP
ncbi:MAG TPA: MBL fold metallo-hydrolase [Egibacteraceae bacterium]|nr:MBL fold metallo-hydrolase [Egibacteraceae bacterium]